MIRLVIVCRAVVRGHIKAAVIVSHALQPLGRHLHMNLAEIKTDVKNGRTLVLIKDSYGNALTPYFIGSFEKIFKMYDIPFFADYTVKLMQSPFTEAVISLLEAEEKNYDFVLTRRPVEVDTVYYEMKTDTIGYLQLTEFNEVSAGQMKKAIEDLKGMGCRQLILDIRNNPGGLLSSVLEISDLFLKKDKLIFSMEDKAGQVYEYYSESGKAFDGEVLVLVNGNSASASEVLTGCLKDHGEAVIMGEKTFGKGIVQGFFKLSDGSALKLTTEHYKTPGGHDIHKIGIEPDIQGADDPATEGVDELLEQAIEYFQNR